MDYDLAAEQDEQDATDALSPVQDDTHTAEDEDYYVTMILSGMHDEAEGDALAAEREFPGDNYYDLDLDALADEAADRYEAQFFGH
jgi:hypothetical protein